MAIKDSIVNLKKGLRTTLTNVPALIDTLIRGLDGVAEAAEEENTYSTSEHVVGKWIDGSEIYERTYDIGALPNATTKSTEHNITNLDKIISIAAVGSSATLRFPIPYIYGTKTDINFVNIFVDNVNITVNCTGDRSSYNGVVTVRYTKSTASRSPEENDNKNGDEEKKDEELKNER